MRTMWALVKFVVMSVFLLVVGSGAVIFFGALAEQAKTKPGSPKATVRAIVGNRAANDLIEQYNTIVRNNGSAVDRHVRASLIAETYLQSGDEENYLKWKQISDAHARNAGLPIPR